MFTGTCEKQREMDWQLLASYFTVKSTDNFYSVRPIRQGSIKIMISEVPSHQRQTFYHVVVKVSLYRKEVVIHDKPQGSNNI